MIYAIPNPMHDEPMYHYPLTHYEVEMLSIFRGLPPSGKALVANVMASQAGRRYVPIKRVELSLVRKPA